MAGIVEKTYAEAVFGLGKEQNCLETLCTEIFETAKIFGENPDFIKMKKLAEESFENMNYVKDGGLIKDGFNWSSVKDKLYMFK